ncbi:thioredoxin-like 1-1, chloroplastic [Ricinus communis]|uniref:Thioredoxin, putative n=1 Tax=Ricinus communis TaxID=3988 RepID=B9SHJ2_RICCO|nr:thioredoxin-like 1-1, chloroplastic [Ricinus communis]EEF36951.1 Thioredoxin, putative [Ricinus communis]|eukprot:XP_002525461.1 thioredoxin-like 1-1, chloroplastic [Ricinus communis]
MADVLSKTNLVPSSCCNGYKNQKKDGAFVLKRSCSLKVSSRKFNPQAFGSQKISLISDFYGKRVIVQEKQLKRGNFHQFSIKAQTGLRLKNAPKWWEKGLQPNMKEITSAQDLVDSLMNAGDKLVIVDFFSPGCGGCKALHPKICQFAEMNPDVQFLQVNYEEHKSMCYSLNVHVLPFFRFYRGAQGRVCSFSCTNATIKKFKDALAKHTPDRCSLGPTKGLEEKELIALASNKDLNFTCTPKPVQPTAPAQEEIIPAALTPAHVNQTLPLPIPLSTTSLMSAQDLGEKTLVTSGR